MVRLETRWRPAKRRDVRSLALTAVVMLASINQCVGVVSAQTRTTRTEAAAISEEALARSMSGGFKNGYALVNEHTTSLRCRWLGSPLAPSSRLA